MIISFAFVSGQKEIVMSRICEICGKSPSFGRNVSHSHKVTRRRFNPNIQRIRAVVNGTPKTINVCTKCLKAGKVTRSAKTSL